MALRAQTYLEALGKGLDFALANFAPGQSPGAGTAAGLLANGSPTNLPGSVVGKLNLNEGGPNGLPQPGAASPAKSGELILSLGNLLDKSDPNKLKTVPLEANRK